MSRSLMQHFKDLHGQLVILIGSAIRLLGGEAGLFVVANEAFDPQSSEEYTVYQINEAAVASLLEHIQRGSLPTPARPFVVERLPPSLLDELDLFADFIGPDADPESLTSQARSGQRLDSSSPGQRRQTREYERCSLILHDQSGLVGTLHYLRPAESSSCLENDQIRFALFRAQLAASMRFALKAQSLVREQERLAAIFQYSTDGILTVDHAFRIIDFNPAMERLTGWRESEVLGRFYYDVLRPKDRQGNDLGLENSPILQAFAGKPVVNREIQITARDGQRFSVSVSASCVHSARGEPMNGILTVRDISREREQEEQRSMFISVISHELQTPIAIIKGYASTLARSDASFDRETLRARLLAIEEEADRLNKLVGNLLYASRIEAGGLHMEIAPLDLEPLIRGVVRRFQARSADLDIKVQLPPNLPLVMADRDRIEEVLENLLDNALKYSPRQRTVTVSCSTVGDEVIVSVSDQGMGISLRDQERLFQRFQRINHPSTSGRPGAGLGLYICRAIIEAHGGRIWVESALHQGSTFSFSLPRKEKAQLPMVVF
ncbi:MAG: PAS domain S-box protein [Thermogemmatispora sp.]|uniref:sensor histidine kinase n=1 Tax=Thermogemmatispora sp. TaxID=1968838 RepID=UPI0026260508|nr:ATP-binding protein [Thermogemmatispora sp.]MBX5456846.1 PAS domain S-box protein [Thermogemmatispora sp.]